MKEHQAKLCQETQESGTEEDDSHGEKGNLKGVQPNKGTKYRENSNRNREKQLGRNEDLNTKTL